MKLTVRNVIFVIIIIICIVAVGLALYWQFFKQTGEKENKELVSSSEEIKILEENFKNIFQNQLDYQGYEINTTGVTKIDSSQDLIYTWVEREKTVDGRYELNLHIPRVNISNNTSVEKFNEKIQAVFIEKANDIILHANNNSIYTVEYMGYVNTNILSLVIKSTLKEGNNPQRVIIQTYNYNLSTNEEIGLLPILEIKALQAQVVENTIIERVTLANQEAQNLKNLGYNVYIRDLTSNIYKIENTDSFILGKDGRLYIIYPYGNANYTDETDIVVF